MTSKILKIKWLLLLLYVTTAYPGTIPLVWDPSTTEGVEYKLYGSKEPLTAENKKDSLVILNAGNVTSVVVGDVPEGILYWAVVATKGGVESALSNVIVVEVPGKPENARVLSTEIFKLLIIK